MVIGQHPDGRIFLMAHEYDIPAMVKYHGKWDEKMLDLEELMEFTPVRDNAARQMALDEAKKAFNSILQECICPKECDCANPEPESGVALISNACPKHNLYPEPVDECPAEKHNGGQTWSLGR